MYDLYTIIKYQTLNNVIFAIMYIFYNDLLIYMLQIHNFFVRYIIDKVPINDRILGILCKKEEFYLIIAFLKKIIKKGRVSK